jgi:hypothetical protein
MILILSNLNSHVRDFNLIKIIFFLKKKSHENDFYEQMFKIAYCFRDYFEILS